MTRTAPSSPLVRVGRIAFAAPAGLRGGFAEARTYGCALREASWPPLPDGSERERRAAREREAVWEAWWLEEQASSVQKKPERFDPATVEDRLRERMAVLREQRQLSSSDDETSLLTPDPGRRWLRAATYLPTPSYVTRRVRGRALLDAGPSLLWVEGSHRTPQEEALIDALAAVASAYRPGPPPDDAFALNLGALVGPPLRPRRPSGMETAGRMGKEFARASFVEDSEPWEYPPGLHELSVTTREEARTPPSRPDLTFEQGLAITNAQLGGVGRFSVVRDRPREAGGRTGDEQVSLYREGGEHPELALTYDWLSRGTKADPLRPEIGVTATAELDPSLSEGEVREAEAAARAVWGAVLDSLVSPVQLATRDR